MEWLLLAVFVRFLWACTNMIDQHVSRYFCRDAVLSVVLLQNMMALPSALIMMMIVGVPDYPGRESLLWIGMGVAVSVLAVIPYLRVLQTDEARNISPLFEFTPILVLLLAWAILGEVMVAHQMMGALIVIICGFLFMWDFNHNRIKRETMALMLVASFLYALAQLALRSVSQEMSPWDVSIFFSAGYFIGGLVLALFRPRTASMLLDGIKRGRGTLLGWASVEEFFSRTAFVCLVYAFALAPTAGHVAAFSAMQPVFVIILSVIIGGFSHHHFPKVKWDRDIQVKIVLLAIMVGGIVLLRWS